MDEILDEKTYETRVLQYASFTQRTAALLIDVVLLVLISYVLNYIFRWSFDYKEFLMEYWLPVVAVVGLYFIFFDGSEMNATIGKQMMNIRMLGDNKLDIDYITSAKHYFFSVLIFFGYLALLSKNESKTLADHYCKVGVIKVR